MSWLHWYTNENTIIVQKTVETANSDVWSNSMIFSETATLTRIFALVAWSRITINRDMGTGRMTIAVDLTWLSSSDISDFQAAVSANTDVAANTAARHTHANKTTLDKFSESGWLLFDWNAITVQNPFIWQWQDWTVTISSNTTLSRDMYYDNLTVDAWIRLSANWYRIFVRNTLTVNGIISNNGSNASGSTFGAWAPAWTLKWWLDWKNGSAWATWSIPAVAGTAWVNWTAIANSLSVNGVWGWKWWDTWDYWGSSIASWGVASTGWTATPAVNLPKSLYQYMAFVDANYATNNAILYYSPAWWAGWGWGWAAYGTPATWWTGWGGGWGGWHLFIYARIIVISATGIIESNWWNGWNGTNGTGWTWWQTAWGWGGWGGWSGWDVILIYTSLTNSGTIRSLWWAPWSWWSPLLFGWIWATAGNPWTAWNNGNIYQYIYS